MSIFVTFTYKVLIRYVNELILTYFSPIDFYFGNCDDFFLR